MLCIFESQCDHYPIHGLRPLNELCFKYVYLVTVDFRYAYTSTCIRKEGHALKIKIDEH